MAADKNNAGEAGELPEMVGRGSKNGTLKDFKRALNDVCNRRKMARRKFNPFGEKLGRKDRE